MAVEYVTRGLSFDNLYVEVTVQRWICDDCGKREAFHDSHKPYGEEIPTPETAGWKLAFPFDDGEQRSFCKKCSAPKQALALAGDG